MKKVQIGLACVALLALAASGAWATIRINGNQMLEAGDSVERDIQKSSSSRSVAAAAPAQRLVMALGQGIQGRGQLPGAPGGGGDVAVVIGIGLEYDVGNQAYGIYCPVDMTGDVNMTGAINAADIIHCVNFVFKSGPLPLPCEASGDVNCNGSVTAADVIYLVNYVFKGQSAPCDVCPLIGSVWSCP
jgi:hypothetical protein